jgi:transcriptional regulator with GAF, ATPase, and Fis domain
MSSDQQRRSSSRRGSDPRELAGYATDDTHTTRVDDALRESEYSIRWMRHHGADNPAHVRSGCAVALVAVIAEPLTNAPVLRLIHTLKQSGHTIFCYGHHASAWTLGAASRLLIAGASHVLDSANDTFAADLRERLDNFVAGELNREQEDHLLASQMRALGIIGRSAAIMNVCRWLVSVSAVSSLPVLLVGETGTGKELAARAIHSLDLRRRQQSFVAVNCAAMTSTLAESELFGHRRGAFTGADRDRRGLIRAAHGGTLFLDEIGDLEFGLQAKLLRVLQERRVLAIGEDREVPVDVRIIAATNRDLEEMVRTSQFRADLFHRLSTLSMRLPSLRDRVEDTAALVDHFVAKHDDAAQVGPIRASAEFVAALQHVSLQGNIRQLENVVHRAIMCPGRGNLLRLRDLPPEIWTQLAGLDSTGLSAAAGPTIAAAPGRFNAVAILEAVRWKLGPALDRCEEEIVTAALDASSGNRTRAARMLGISPRTFFNKMRKHRLSA